MNWLLFIAFVDPEEIPEFAAFKRDALIINDPDERILVLLKYAIPKAVVLKRLTKFVLFPEHFDPEAHKSESATRISLAAVTTFPFASLILAFTLKVSLLVEGFIKTYSWI